MTMTSPACLCYDPAVIFPRGTRWSHGDHREDRYRGGSVHGEDAQRVLCVLFQLQFILGAFLSLFTKQAVFWARVLHPMALVLATEEGGTGANLSTGALHTHDDGLTPK
jgi:hypothetical protein